jgi:hypothetical protein
LVIGLTALGVAQARAADEVKIQQAMQRGLDFLKSQQDPASGTWPFFEPRVGAAKTGATALAGVTLLECGVPADDPAVQKAAEAVRQASITLTQTYGLSTSILFLDRLGDPGDIALIQSMAVRLLAGQNSSGGWSYDCPPISRQEVVRLTAQLRKPDDPTKPRATPQSSSRDRRGVPPEIERQLSSVRVPGTGRQPFSDNSNTKFATLALWVARRHRMPVEKALGLVETRFHNTQNPDGGWGYGYMMEGRGRGGMGESTGSMTCAGLLGLATGHAAEVSLRTDSGARDLKPSTKRARRDPSRDPAIQAGLMLLGKIVGNEGQPPIRLFGTREGDEYYFLWALERVAVAYGLQTVGNKDWYAWGSDLLLAKQGQDGGWHGKYEGGVDTCFALLFLKRANLSRDLTVTLSGQVMDPAGRGKAALPPNSAPKPAMRPEVKPSQESAQTPRPVQPKDQASGKPAETTRKPAPSGREAEEGELERETARLVEELVDAQPARQGKLLEAYQERKGVAYTQALAMAIPKLGNPMQNKAREALAERLSRMTAATLRARLKDDDTEIRRAAALACAMKEDKERIPDLIGLLEDPQPTVVHAAHAALKNLTHKDFGPAAGASHGDPAAAAAAWKSWWDKEKKK